MTKSFFIFGLGNPRPKYTHTRHNVGHLVVSFLKRTSPLFNLAVNKEYLMNDVGLELTSRVEQENVSLARLVVVHDDMDIPLGEFRLQKGRGSAGHLGVLSIIKELGSNNFWRLRVGIGRPPEGVLVNDYVLQKFTKDELGKLERNIPQIVERIKLMVSN